MCVFCFGVIMHKYIPWVSHVSKDWRACFTNGMTIGIIPARLDSVLRYCTLCGRLPVQRRIVILWNCRWQSRLLRWNVADLGPVRSTQQHGTLLQSISIREEAHSLSDAPRRNRSYQNLWSKIICERTNVGKIAFQEGKEVSPAPRWFQIFGPKSHKLLDGLHDYRLHTRYDQSNIVSGYLCTGPILGYLTRSEDARTWPPCFQRIIIDSCLDCAFVNSWRKHCQTFSPRSDSWAATANIPLSR